MKHNKFLSKLVALALASTILLSLAACGSAQTEQKEEESPVKTLETAMENLQDVKSLSCNTIAEMEIDIDGEIVQMVVDQMADIITDPMTIYMDMVFDMGSLGAMNTTSFMEEVDGTLMTYTGIDNGTEVVWVKQEVTDTETIEQSDVRNSAEYFFTAAENFEQTSSTTEDGVEYVRFTGTVPEENVEKVLKTSGLMDTMGSTLGITEDAISAADLLQNLPEITIDIWVDTEAMMPVGFEMDFSDVCQTILDGLMDAASEGTTDIPSVDVNTLYFTIDLYNFDEVDPIEIPEEARNADSVA